MDVGFPDGTDGPGDWELAEAFLADRDEVAFRTLYRRHAPALYLFVQRYLGGRGEGAEDVLQETWLRAASRLDAFRWSSSLRTWLIGIAVNCCRERRRVAAPVPEADAPERAAAAADDLRMDLEAAVRALPDGCRTVLLLHDLEGYTHPEIGRLLAIDEGTSRSQLFRARAKLRSRLSGRTT